MRSQSKQYWIDRALSNLYSPFVGLKLGAWRDDPFGLFGQWVQARAQETPVRPRDGRLFVGEGPRQYVVLPFTLRVPAFSMAAQQALIPLIEQARRSRLQGCSASRGCGSWCDSVRRCGRRASESGSVHHRLRLNPWHHRVDVVHVSLSSIALMMLSVGIGCFGALSVCWLLFERIHLLTLVFGASLIGGAQDYGTYFLCNRLAADAQPFDSWQLLRRLLPALVLTLVTTVIGYMGLALTPFPGLRQMAVFSVGADICLVDRGLLVSRTGSDWHTQKRATGTGVCREFRALAVFALTAIHILGGWIVYRVNRTRFVATGCPG